MQAEDLRYYYGLRKLVIAIIAVVLVILVFNFVDVFKSFELQVLDFLIAWKGQSLANDNVVLVKVDDETVAELGWPLSRIYYADLVKKLNTYGAKVIAFDFLFNDRTPDTFIEDSTLVYTIDEAGNIINSFNFEVWSGEQNYKPGVDDCVENSYSKYALNLNSHAITNYYRASTAIFPHEDFLDFFEMAGHVIIIQDIDGHFRRIPLIINYEGCFYPSLAFKAICKYLNISENDISIEKSYWGDNFLIDVQSETIRIPINTKGQVLLNYYGDMDVFQQYSLLDVLNSNISAKHFRDRIVLVGKTITGDKDSHVIPFSADFPGIGFHATLISNMLDKNFIKEIPFIANFIILLLLSMVVAFYPYKKYQKLLYLTIFPVLWIIALVFLGYFFIKLEIAFLWIKIVQISMAVIISFMGVNIFEKFEAYKRIQNIKDNLSKNEVIIKEKDKIIEVLNMQLQTLKTQSYSIEVINNDFKVVLNKATSVLKKYLDNIYKHQIKFQTAIERHLTETEISRDTIKNEKTLIENQNKQLLNEKNRLQISNIGSFRELEIYVADKEIVIKGTSGKSQRIYFSPAQMAFIYYLATAKDKGKEWIKNSKIMNIDEAKKASEIFGHKGIVGCKYWGQKKLEWIEKIDVKDYEPDAAFTRKLSYHINEKIKNYLFLKANKKFIRTPDTVQDGRYFLTTSITKVVFHRKTKLQ